MTEKEHRIEIAIYEVREAFERLEMISGYAGKSMPDYMKLHVLDPGSNTGELANELARGDAK